MNHIRDNYLDKYLQKHKLDLNISMIKGEKDNKFATITTISCRITGDIIIHRQVQSIPDDEMILNWLREEIRKRKINQLFC